METDADAGFNYETAETLAATWESRRPFVERVAAPVREWMVAELQPHPGDTVLELAAGVGDTGFEVSRVIGEEGLLISTDFSPAMLAAAERRGRELGVGNVEYRVVDAEQIDLDTDAVDGVLCRFGYMLMVDPGAALAETRRVLRDDGWLTLAVWGAVERNPFFTTIAGALVQRGRISPPEPPPAPGLFSMADVERTTALLSDAGFRRVRTEEVDVHFQLPSMDEYIDIVADTAGPLALALRNLSSTERAEIRSAVGDGLARFETADGYDIPGVALCAVASS